MTRAFNVQSYCKIRNGVNKIVKKYLNKILSCQYLERYGWGYPQSLR